MTVSDLSSDPGGGDLLLVTATLQEMRAVLAPLGGASDLAPLKPRVLKAGRQTRILLITGVGPLNAAMALGRIMGSDLRVRGVVNFGIAGSFDCQTLPLLSQIVVQEEIWPEIGVKTGAGLVDLQALCKGLGEGQEALVQDRLDLNPPSVAPQLGLTLPGHWEAVKSLTVAGVTGTPAEAGRLAGRYGVHTENMEGFALAWVCRREGLPFLELRSVSNQVGSRNKRDWDIQGSLSGLGEMSRLLLC
ncbi:MAG: futalosine hydrolase [Desulfohalobiaceae bacterium]|nr:futalosine hydrolase [Desulfohalobiaceae bacterium]